MRHFIITVFILGTATACGTVEADRGGEPTPSGIEIRSADTKGGLVVSYASPELSFVLEGLAQESGVWSRLRAPDGTILTELTMPAVDGGFGSTAMLAAIDEVAANLDLADAARYQVAVESIIPFLSASGDPRQAFLDENLGVPLQQVLLLAAIGNGGASESAPCPDYLANPRDEAYHTMADHMAMIAQLPAEELAKATEIPCKWYQLCCWHDYACITCGAGLGAGYQVMCGPTCEISMECMGRCGGGCGAS